MLHSICQPIWKTQQWPQDWKTSVFILIPKKGNAKECWNYHTIACIAHTSIFLGSKITTDGECSHEIKRRLLLGIKTITNLDSILKSRDITLPTKVCIVKATVFPVVMYGCESYTIKNPSTWRIDAFVLYCWRRLLRVPWTAKRSNQIILKEINPEYSLAALLIKLKLQYFGHLVQRDDWLEKTLRLGKTEGKRRGQQRIQWLDSITDTMDTNLRKLHQIMENRRARRAIVYGIAKSRIWLKWLNNKIKRQNFRNSDYKRLKSRRRDWL